MTLKTRILFTVAGAVTDFHRVPWTLCATHSLMRLSFALFCLDYFSTKQIVLQEYTTNKKERLKDALLF